MLTVSWGLVDSPLSGIVFLLALLGLSAVRYRFAPYRALPALEAALCVGFAFLWLPALLGLWLPAVGLLEDRWAAMERELLGRDFEDRARRYQLEDALQASERDVENAARLAQVNERARIAQEIHDHVGHEIAGASLALQAAAKLHEKGDPRAGELLAQCQGRLESASARLRETVHNLKPAQTPGAEGLEALCGAFAFCPARFTACGDLEGVAHWDLLAANLKEALTNVSRHSRAKFVTVKLDGNAAYIRMIVADDGKSSKPYRPGLGLSGMRERVRAAGGTLTVNAGEGFQVVCVLPKVKGECQ
ncbi:MAG: sensor histidine kinase [Oscillospiraceae bacterium]|jgi:signal transduction histidine kinase|nr:sensor histidine kinase [Oscillospiraceae bacterium]